MTKLDDAIAYLRSRNLYCIDQGTKFKWRHGSDVAKAATAEERRLKEHAEHPAKVTSIRRAGK